MLLCVVSVYTKMCVYVCVRACVRACVCTCLDKRGRVRISISVHNTC